MIFAWVIGRPFLRDALQYVSKEYSTHNDTSKKKTMSLFSTISY
jgi:hypothetical protein